MTSDDLILTWRGRDRTLDGLDEWNCPLVDLRRRMVSSRGIAVADPLSFPWDEAADALRNTPWVLLFDDARPHGSAEIQAVEFVMTEPPTPFDRVVTNRADFDRARAELRTDSTRQKRAFLLAVDITGGEIVAAARDMGVVHATVRTFAGAKQIASDVAVRWTTKELAIELEPPVPEQAPDVVVLTEQDLRTDGEALATAFDAVEPGGSVILLVDTMDADLRSGFRSTSTLFDEVASATAGRNSLEEVRAIRWPGESISRSALLRFSSLGAALETRGSDI